jgi:DNA transformation protein and related proteins
VKGSLVKSVAGLSLLSATLDLMSGIGELRHRKMFGGVYIYCDDLFIATIHDEILFFKANAFTAPDFVKLGLPPFSYPKDGGIASLQYYQAPPDVFTGRPSMKLWAEKALLAAKQDASRKPMKKAGTQNVVSAKKPVKSKLK